MSDTVKSGPWALQAPKSTMGRPYKLLLPFPPGDREQPGLVCPALGSTLLAPILSSQAQERKSGPASKCLAPQGRRGLLSRTQMPCPGAGLPSFVSGPLRLCHFPFQLGKEGEEARVYKQGSYSSRRSESQAWRMRVHPPSTQLPSR